MNDALLTEKELASRFKVTVRTLQAWRARDQGVQHIKIGESVRYRMTDVLEYEACNTVGGAIPQDARRTMQRAAELLDILAGWTMADGARAKITGVRDDLRLMVARPVEKS